MDSGILYNSTLFSVEILNKRCYEPDRNTDLIAFLQLEGSSNVKQGGRNWHLREKDYLFINPGDEFNCLLPERGMIAIVRIRAENSVISDCLDLEGHEVYCNSFDEGDTGRSQIRRYLGNILHGAMSDSRENSARICSECFLLIQFLSRRYLIAKSSAGYKDPGSIERESQIISYLEKNYAHRITLDDLSKETFLSSAYLSRYISRHFGEKFHSLLTDIRIQKAESRVALSQENLTKIALDTGFPSTAAFNKAFAQKYGLTPSAYRRDKGDDAKKPQETNAVSDSSNNTLEAQFREYITTHDIRLSSMDMETIRIEGNVHDCHMFRRFWSRMINGGLAHDFLRADMQEHTMILRSELGFSYIRIWDIYAPDMMLYDGNKEHHYNFSRLDTVLDFLINSGLHPFIELGFKPVLLLKRVGSDLIREERVRMFRTASEYAGFLQQMLRHYAVRYGIPEIETWYFEIWQDFRFQSTAEYFTEFDAAYSAIKTVSPKVHVGGPGISGENPIPLEKTIRDWKGRHLYPDFISVYIYPYLENGSPNDGHFGRSMDSSYLRKYLDSVLDLLHENGFWHQEVLVSEWNLSVSNRCVLHDSLYKGAYIMHSLASMVNRADGAGYWFGSDLNSEYYDSQHLIDGSAGLISKNGIRKPAFYGFEFFNRLADYVIFNDENAIVTTNLHDSYSIVCHNMRDLGYQYFQKSDDEVKPEEISGFFDGESRQFHFRIQGVQNGMYQIKRRVINSQYGSVQDEWMRMGLTDNLNRMDIEYLRRICVPHITIENHEVTDSTLDFSVVLDANAIENIHVYLLI